MTMLPIILISVQSVPIVGQQVQGSFVPSIGYRVDPTPEHPRQFLDNDVSLFPVIDDANWTQYVGPCPTYQFSERKRV
jgi:hypothetical protein